jgi:hypothetical protein
MTSYAEAQARLADAKRRRDSRAVHAAIIDSKRLLTKALRKKFPRKAPLPLFQDAGRGR